LARKPSSIQCLIRNTGAKARKTVAEAGWRRAGGLPAWSVFRAGSRNRRLFRNEYSENTHGIRASSVRVHLLDMHDVSESLVAPGANLQHSENNNADPLVDRRGDAAAPAHHSCIIISFAFPCLPSIVANYPERLVSPANAVRYGMGEGGECSVTSAEEPGSGGNASVNAGEVAIRQKRRAPADIGNARRRAVYDARFTCIFFNPLQFLLAQKLIRGLNSTHRGGSFITRVLRSGT
jgi:hypothetical protein